MKRLLNCQEMKEAGQGLNGVLAENNDLKRKLANAEEKVREFGKGAPKNGDEVAAVKLQVAQLQQQLAETQKQNQYFAVRVAELHVQLDETSNRLQNAKLTDVNSEEATQLAKENELLRNIVVRERQEEALRYQAKEQMLAALDKLKIKSAGLNKQIELLAQPVTKLRSEELALLRQPVVSISERNPGMLKASFIFAKKSPPDFNKVPEPAAREGSAYRSGGATTDGSSNATGPSDFQADVPADLADVARAAKESFDRGKYQRPKSNIERS